MLRYSYKVLEKEYEAKLLGLKLDEMKNPDNIKIIEKRIQIEKELNWIKDRISKGLDPGCIIL